MNSSILGIEISAAMALENLFNTSKESKAK
jgi:hypothetical protein